METPQTEIQAILNEFLRGQEIKTLDGGRPILFGPTDYKVTDLEPLLQRPLRVRARIDAHSSGSFQQYVSRHKGFVGTTIYAEIDVANSALGVKAILDDNDTGSPAWRQHICSYAPDKSVEWKRWTLQNAKLMSQSEFGTFLEDNLSDIKQISSDGPSGSDILAMALAFEANADKRMRSKVSLQSGGVQFEFVDDESKDTRSRMMVFERFHIAIPVFENSGSAYPIQARLKYRVSSEKVSFWYELIRPDRAFRTACGEELDAISLGLPDVPIIHGVAS